MFSKNFNDRGYKRMLREKVEVRTIQTHFVLRNRMFYRYLQSNSLHVYQMFAMCWAWEWELSHIQESLGLIFQAAHTLTKADWKAEVDGASKSFPTLLPPLQRGNWGPKRSRVQSQELEQVAQAAWSAVGGERKGTQWGGGGAAGGALNELAAVGEGQPGGRKRVKPPGDLGAHWRTGSENSGTWPLHSSVFSLWNGESLISHVLSWALCVKWDSVCWSTGITAATKQTFRW